MNHARSAAPTALNHEKGLDFGVRLRELLGSRGKRVDVRNGEEEIPADDEPDLTPGSRTLN